MSARRRGDRDRHEIRVVTPKAAVLLFLAALLGPTAIWLVVLVWSIVMWQGLS